MFAVLAVTSSLSLAEQTQRERDIEDGDGDQDVVLTSSMITDVSFTFGLPTHHGLMNEWFLCRLRPTLPHK
jgi:hypothetical protein